MKMQFGKYIKHAILKKLLQWNVSSTYFKFSCQLTQLITQVKIIYQLEKFSAHIPVNVHKTTFHNIVIKTF